MYLFPLFTIRHTKLPNISFRLSQFMRQQIFNLWALATPLHNLLQVSLVVNLKLLYCIPFPTSGIATTLETYCKTNLRCTNKQI